MARRAIVLGIDGFILRLAEHMVAQGGMPNLARMLREGAATQLLPFISSWGPINWMSFATGASPGSAWHGTVPVPETWPASRPHGAYGAEPLWETLARQGRSSVVLAYPAAWPPTTAQGFIGMPDRAATDLVPVAIAGPARYLTRDLQARYAQPPGTTAGYAPLRARGQKRTPPPALDYPAPPRGWQGIIAEGVLASSITVGGARGHAAWKVGVLVPPAGVRAPLLFCDGQHAQHIVGCALPGQWSEWIGHDSPDGIPGHIRFKVLELSDDRRSLAIAHSLWYPDRGVGSFPEHEAGLLAHAGPYTQQSSAALRPTDPFWDTAVQEAEYEARWLVRAAEYAASVDDWSLFATVFRPPDAANHGCLAYLDPDTPYYDESLAQEAMRVLEAAYGAADIALGLFMELADDDTVVALASDHGAFVNRVTCDIYNLLVAEGLMALTTNAHGYPCVDMANSRAYIKPSRSAAEIFVNLQGREPEGIVPPDEYEALQTHLVDLLYRWTEPETGARAVGLALRRQDAPIAGYWGPFAGDVQFIYHAGCVWGALPEGKTIVRTTIPSVNHGPQMPTAQRGLASNMGMLALWGAGVRPGYRRDEATLGPPRMSDAAPTLAHLLGCPAPAQNEGAVLGEMIREV